MPDYIGGLPVTDPPVISAFPIKVDFGGGIDYQPDVSMHVFDEVDLKTEQRFVMGPGSRRIRVRRDHLTKDEYSLLKNHYLQAQGVYASFPITTLGPGGKEIWNVRYENPAIAFDHMAAMLTGDPGLTLIVVPDAPGSWPVAFRVSRFPDQNLASQLAAQTQHIFPLLTIQDRETKSDGTLKNPPNYFSNQRVIVDNVTYLPRLLTWSGITQTLSEASDSASFTLGNADDIFTKWANATNLYRAIVQFSLYHAESGYLIYIWGGYARNWQLDTSGRFVLPCSNGTFELTLGYPTRLITRWCWKVYKGIHCPSTSSFTSCPKDYDSCVARGVPQSFGGLVVPEQGVRIKDSTTGVMGWGRSWMTSVTITSDTIYQNPLQEIWTNEAMLVDAPLMGGRDENDFYAAIGMVSDGPIGGYNMDLALQQLDNAPPHDALHGGGWRGVGGNDPANATVDYVGISQAPWNTVPPGSTYSAGLAFAEIRRTDAAGLQVAPLSDHSMQISVTSGVGGWTWSAPGQRSWQLGLANTAWVAINVYLRGIGLRVTTADQAAAVPASVMEQYFDVNQAIYVASICDLLVDKILPAGGGQENQFPFRGVLKERKPLKDWLTEIMKCCNGYWTFVNGKLWLGIRENASVGTNNAFTQAHVKYKTLQVTLPQPQFNWLDVQFGDEEYNFALNKVTYYDEDHAMKVGSAENPQYMQGTMTLVGVSNLSQAARCATTRCREETGGIVIDNPDGSVTDEQLLARNFSFSTTVLSLTTLVGDVISLDHPKLPNGRSKGRVQSWTLNPDFSIDLQATCVTDSMYAMDMGPKPADVLPPALPVPKLQWIMGMAWIPGYLAAQVNDPLYIDMAERTFELWQDYTLAADGSWSPAIWVKGYLNVNTVASTDAPRIADVALSGGGHLSGGQTLYFCLIVQDANHHPFKVSNLSIIWIPPNLSSQQATLTFMPPISAPYSFWGIYAGPDRRVMVYQDGGNAPLPATYNYTGPTHSYTYGLPTPFAHHVQIGVKHLIHAGIAGMLVTGVTGNDFIQCNDFIGSTDNWVGRFVSAIADQNTGYAPLLNFNCVGFDSTTGTMQVFPAWGTGEQAVEAGDVLIVRSIAQTVTANADGSTTVADAMWNNSVARNQFNSPGLNPGDEPGRILRVLRGAGMGQSGAIVQNDATSITVSTTLVGLDTSSIITVEDANWAYVGSSSPVSVPIDHTPVQIRIPVDNLANMVALVGGFLNDGDGHLTDDPFAVHREIFIFGQPPVSITLGPGAGPFDVDPTWQTVNVDTSQNNVTLTLPPLSNYDGRTLLVFNLFSGQVIINTFTGSDGSQETFYDGSTQQIIATQGESLRITSTGDATPTARLRKRTRFL